MPAEIDSEFISTFHPLPNRERRLVLTEMKVTGVSYLDDNQFFGWLAERYRCGEGPLVDAAIRKKSAKYEERCLEAMLYDWLLVRSGTTRRRHHNRPAIIRTMSTEILSKGGSNAAILRALALNYPTFDLRGDADGSDGVAMAAFGSAAPPITVDADQTPLVGGSLDDPAVTLDRLVAVLPVLREYPDATLLEWARTFADAIAAHGAAQTQAARDHSLLAERRDGLARKFTAFEEILTGKFETPSVDQMTIEAVERIEQGLIAFEIASRAYTKARDHARASFDAGKAERALANEEFDRAETERDAAIERLSADIASAKAQLPAAARADVGAISQVPDNSALGAKQPTNSSAAPIAEADGPEVATPARSEAADLPAVAVDPVDEIVVPLTDAQLTVPANQATALEVTSPDFEKLPAINAASLPDALPEAPSNVDDECGTELEEPDVPTAPIVQFQSWDGWITTALTAGRYGLALHLADGEYHAGAQRGDSYARPVLEGVLRGNLVQTAYGRSWMAYEDLRSSLLDAADATRTARPGTDLLLFAGALRPALVQSGAALSLIEALNGEVVAALQPLRSVVEHVASLRLNNIAELAATPDHQAARQRASEGHARLAEWARRAPSRKMNYQPATLVWQELLASHGPLGRALALALGGNPDAVAEVRAIAAALDEDSDKAIDDAHTNVLKGIRKDAIEGMARKHLLGQITNATALLSNWADVEKELKPREDRFGSHRTRLLAAFSAARDAVLNYASGDPLLCVATSVFDALLRSIESQLLGGLGPMPFADEALDWEIALLPRFPLNGRTGLRIEADDVENLAKAARAAITDTLLTPDDAFAQALTLGAASSARRLAEHLAPVQAEQADKAIDLAIERERDALAARVRSTRQLLDDLQIATVAGSSELDELERAMTSFERMVVAELPRDVGERGSIADFPTANFELDRMNRLLEKVREPQRADLEMRISALEILHETVLDDCRAQLVRGDLGTLSEEVDQIEKYGIAGPPDPAPLTLLASFTELLRKLGDKPAVPLGNLPRAAREGVVLGEYNFSELSTLDRDRSETLLEAWIALRRSFQPASRKVDPVQKVRETAVRVMTALGWTGVDVKECERDTSWYKLSVTSVALRRREDCPAPAFGSERVPTNSVIAQYALVIAGPDDVDACIGSLDRLPNPVLLFITEPLTSRQRREILRKTRRGMLSVAVADAVTIAMLAMTPDARTRQFFDLAIPMGGAQPYADKGSETAIENFFGRERELNTLFDSRGASFVYGGRQLGKTALLKQIELRQRDNADQIAVYCFIKEAGNAQAVWSEIHSKLTARGIVLAKTGSVPSQLQAWVEQKPGRYLLIMLDEADAFLEAEMAANFPTIELMKALMADTQRGVKFVFAGLHNVQRFYRAPNSPLLHLGVPVNVGPLLGADRRAARQMALEPMAALGFAFEDKIDAYHMLSLIGFYPSLMQSFGKAVVTAMNEHLSRSGEPDKMPMMIKRDLIDACFNEQTFRQGVLNRFQQTLQLDERYELITYAVWDRMQDDSQGGRSTALGYTAAEISKLARDWWPAGFAETDSLESFTAILDEMEEMGVLTRKADLYALRSQRIAAMLGGRSEIGVGLQALIERGPRRRADPLANHRRIEKRWSPLTLRQEAAIQKLLADPAGPKIIMLGATKAAGLEELRDAIDALVTAPSFGWPKPKQLKSANPEAIVDVATRVRRDATIDAPGVLIVEGAWPSPQELTTLRKDRVLRETARPVRLILCGVPTAAVLAMPTNPELLISLVGPLTPEMLVHWMNREQLGFSDEPQVQAALRDASGGWLEALEAASPSPGVRKAGSDALIESARASAAKLTLSDIGIAGVIEDFARDLLREQGGTVVAADDMATWASMVDAEAGPDQLRLLEALGVVETAPSASGEAMLRFNPIAARLLA